MDIIENSKLIAFIGVLTTEFFFRSVVKDEKTGIYVENMTFPPIPHKGPGAEFRPSSMHKEGQ